MNAPQKQPADPIDEGREVTIDASAISTIVKGEIDMQIATAHRWPRSVATFRKDALALVTQEQVVAEACCYVLRRKQWDKEKREFITVNIEGPSARFAEVICSTWGNVRWGSRVVGERDGFIVAQGMFHDLQHNSAGAIEIERSIMTSQGERFKQDMVGVTANAASSIALRNAVLKGIPRAFWNDIYLQARKVAMGDAQTLNNRRAEALELCRKFGVSADQVYALLEVRGMADIGLEHLLTLRTIIGSIRDGEETAERAFPSEADAAAYLGKPAIGAMPRTKDAKENGDKPPAPPAPPAGPSGDEPSFQKVREQGRADAATAAADQPLKQTAPAGLADIPNDPPFDTSMPLFDKGAKAGPLPPPAKASAPGEMATIGEIRLIVQKAHARKFPLDELVSLLPDLGEPPRVTVTADGEVGWLNGLTKEDYRLLKMQFPS